jgi:ABC-type uncharacterized transport system permease subunit
MNTLILTSIEQGLIFSVLAIGVIITFKILDFADMSVEGTFPMGAFIFAKFITSGLFASVFAEHPVIISETRNKIAINLIVLFFIMSLQGIIYF